MTDPNNQQANQGVENSVQSSSASVQKIMTDPDNQQANQGVENSVQSSSTFIHKWNAFLEDPKPAGNAPSTWVPVREQLKESLTEGFVNIMKSLTKKMRISKWSID